MKGDELYLRHILDAIGLIELYAQPGYAAFLESSMRRDAIVRQLEIVGEASKHLTEAARAKSPEIPRRQVCGLRDVLIHEYFGVNYQAVWRVIEADLPVLRAAVEGLLRAG